MFTKTFGSNSGRAIKKRVQTRETTGWNKDESVGNTQKLAYIMLTNSVFHTNKLVPLVLPFGLLKPWFCWNSVDYLLSLLPWWSVPEVTLTSHVGVVTDTKHTLNWFCLLIKSSFFNIICNNSKTATLAITRLFWLSPTAPYQSLCQSTALVSSEWVPRPSCLLFWVAHKSKNPHSCLRHHLDLMMPSSNHLLKYKMTKTRRSYLMAALETVTFPYRLHFYSTRVKSGETVE